MKGNKFLFFQKLSYKYIPNNYYYSGEFGYFNVIVLLQLEKYEGTKITIHTYPDYCYIIKNLFGDKFDCKEIKFAKLRFVHDNYEEESYKRLYQPISKILKLSTFTNNKTFNYISKTITTNYIDNSEKFICYFPRFRTSGNIKSDFNERNSNEKECKYILDLFSPKFKIFIMGNETINFNYDIKNVEKVETIEKGIFYLKNCKFLISNDSGYIDFAKNCGCKNIFILRPIVEYHKYFNPFETNITIIKELKELEKITI